MEKVVVYPGRFQPMLSHHAEVYKTLVDQHPDSEVYIATSNKVDGHKSPFNFAEKKKIAQAHGIPGDRVLEVTAPYSDRSYDFDRDNTVLIFAVGQKDMDRFPTDNRDPDTGLVLTKKGKPAYIQPWDPSADIKPMSEHAYVMLAPTVKSRGVVASASAFRQKFAQANPAQAKKLFAREFGSGNKPVFNLLYKKLSGDTMNEQINEMRMLAGLQKLDEAAPVDYYGMSDQERILADVGRLLMQRAETERDDNLSNALAELGGGLADGSIADQVGLVGFIKNLESGVAAQVADSVKQVMADYSAGKRASGGDTVSAGDYEADDEFDVDDDTEVPELEPDDEVMDSVSFDDIRQDYDVFESEVEQEVEEDSEVQEDTDTDLEEEVESTVNRATDAALAELRKLAGL